MDSFEAYEYVIKPKVNGATRLKKALLIVVYVLFVLSWLLFGVGTPFVALLALIPLTTWMLVFFTWRYTNVEYEYSVETGVITFSKIYGSRSRSYATELDLRTAQAIVPLADRKAERLLNEFEPTVEYSFISHKESPTAYALLYTDADGTRCAVYLEILPNLMKTCKIYNSAALAAAAE